MNIGIVCYPTFGGSGVVATELGKALANLGHKIHFITYSQPVKLDDFTDNVTFHEVEISNYPLFEYPPYEMVLSAKLVDVVKYEKLDLLHVHYAIPHATAAYMARQILRSHGINVPFITTLHGTDITLVGKDPSFEPAITFAINESDAVTAVSESLKRDTYTHFHVTREIEVIPNFVSVDDYQGVRERARHSRKRYAADHEKILIHVSNFRPVKRVEDVVRVFDKVRKRLPAKLLLVGDGPDRPKIESLCRELGTCNDIKFLGKLKATDHALAMADLFVLPSEAESFGLAALEAMAAGLPVISSNTGGLPEVNVDGFSGYLSSVGDVNDMAEKAISILKDDAVLKQFSRNAIEQARKFDLQNVLPMYTQLYEQVLAATVNPA